MKIGDKVRIKTAEELEKSNIGYTNGDWADEYEALKGQIVTVTGIERESIHVNDLFGSFSKEEYVVITNSFSRGDIVYVSDCGEEEARSRKREMIFLAYIEGAEFPHQCTDNSEYTSGDPFSITRFKFAVKKEQKKKLSKAELVRFLEEHGVEVEE